MLSWLRSRRSLHAERDALLCRLAREKEAREVLERQRDALLDMLDRLKWRDRLATAEAMAAVKALEFQASR